MKLYVWSGDKILADHTSGMVMIAADSVDEAWAKLKAEDYCAWFWLWYNIGYIHHQNTVEEYAEYLCFRDAGNSIQPVEYASIAEIPNLIIFGGG